MGSKICSREKIWKYVILKKIKLWYGTPKSGEENIKDKIVLGIQSVYQDIVTGIKTTTEQHCGDLSKDDIEVKELELKSNDYFNKFNIDFDNAITHLKFTTKDGEYIEVGVEKEETKKTVLFNNDKNSTLFVSFKKSNLFTNIEKNCFLLEDKENKLQKKRFREKTQEGKIRIIYVEK